MTTHDRIRELDRLYLAADALTNEWIAAKGHSKELLSRRAARAWKKYQALVKSRKGRPQNRKPKAATRGRK